MDLTNFPSVGSIKVIYFNVIVYNIVNTESYVSWF